MRWMRHITLTEKVIYAYRIFVGKPEAKTNYEKVA
jgi:hypothetical protein